MAGTKQLHMHGNHSLGVKLKFYIQKMPGTIFCSSECSMGQIPIFIGKWPKAQWQIICFCMQSLSGQSLIKIITCINIFLFRILETLLPAKAKITELDRPLTGPVQDKTTSYVHWKCIQHWKSTIFAHGRFQVHTLANIFKKYPMYQGSKRLSLPESLENYSQPKETRLDYEPMDSL